MESEQEQGPESAAPGPESAPIPPVKHRRAWFRLSMATTMMMVVAAAAASALFAKVHQHVPASNQPYLRIDAPALFVASIVLTAVALGALKGHTLVQMMLQATLACLGFTTLIGLAEAGWERPLLYWFQASFAVLVTAPLVARQMVKAEMGRGPRRKWWKNTCEAIFFSFLTDWLVIIGLGLQLLAAFAAPQLVK